MTTMPSNAVDPITTEIVVSRLREIAASMEYALYHSGYSPILRESKDGTAGLTDPEGRVVLIGGGLQYHFTAYQQAVEAVLARYPAATLAPGMSFIGNDPYRVATPHAPDFVAVTPAFHGGALIGFGVSLAHKSDIGGLVPGSSGAAAREIYHDGLLLPPVRFQTEAGIEESIEAIIANNSRVAEVVLGDLRAQVGCTRLGVARLAALCDEYGRDTVRAVMASAIRLTARRVVGELRGWSDGVAEAEGLLDHDGAVKDKPIRIRVRATKRGERLQLDFTGTDAQTIGPVNLVAATAQAASLMAVLAVCDPTIPVNSGLREAVELVLPEGSVVNARHPATVNLYFPTAHLVYNTVLSALGRINPARAVAPSGLGSGAVTVGYRKARSGKPAVLYELLNTSLGGTSRNDGVVAVMAMNHFTPGAPVEIFESEYPLRVRAFELVCDSAGAGRHRGGLGYAREFEVLEDSVLTVRSSNHIFASQGQNGGLAPRPSRVILNPDRPDREELSAIETRHLKAGDVIRFERSGGAGFGPPSERTAEEVDADVRNGYVSAQAADAIYGRPQKVPARGDERPRG
ncbi:MAG: hydantoinase B/oxoprolinase family protein [Hyphomicrobiales bacterium]|nr:hydantoinase B/oxoprolinase family protein [Hyphomicrobiales bacterium]